MKMLMKYEACYLNMEAKDLNNFEKKFFNAL